MVLETPLLSQRNNTKWSEICITCFFSSLSTYESTLSIFSLDLKLQNLLLFHFQVFIYTHLLPLRVVMEHTHDNWYFAVTCRKDVKCRQGTANDKPLGCYVNCNFLCRYVFLPRGEKNRPYTFKKFNRELRFKGFQELRIHHLAIGINESYCSLKNTLHI